MILKIFDFSQAFSENNVTIFIVGYSVVFAALVLLYFVFYSISKLLNVKRRRELFKKGKIKSVDEQVEDISGEVNAAISMALHLHFNEAHDDESYISTIKEYQGYTLLGALKFITLETVLTDCKKAAYNE